MTETLLTITDLRVGFATEAGFVRAVDGASLQVRQANVSVSSADPDPAASLSPPS